MCISNFKCCKYADDSVLVFLSLRREIDLCRQAVKEDVGRATLCFRVDKLHTNSVKSKFSPFSPSWKLLIGATVMCAQWLLSPLLLCGCVLCVVVVTNIGIREHYWIISCLLIIIRRQLKGSALRILNIYICTGIDSTDITWFIIKDKTKPMCAILYLFSIHPMYGTINHTVSINEHPLLIWQRVT